MYTLPQGTLKIAALKRAWADEISRVGNSHWGDHADVCQLSRAMNMGLLIFKAPPQSERCIAAPPGHILYNTGTDRDDFPFWLSLWWIESVHFQKAAVSFGDAFRSCWALEALPAPLLDEYRNCNRMAN